MMSKVSALFGALISYCYVIGVVVADCPDYTSYSADLHGPFSSGRYNLSYQRPSESCRTISLPEVESTIASMKKVIKDPDLGRLFENSFPNTLDTAIRWRGTSKESSSEELAFIITGDINAMWLRDSANQLKSYLPLLKSTNSTLASLFRGVINLQARYLLKFPYCNAFQPPVESGLVLTSDGQADNVNPQYDPSTVYECKYELDSLAAFLQISADYYNATKDADFFSAHNWVPAVKSLLAVAQAQQFPTYAGNGSVNTAPYTWKRQTDRATETLANDGLGNPVGNLTGLIRSAFRPSDDACIYEGFIPANMMFSHYLSSAAQLMSVLPYGIPLSQQMQTMAQSVQNAIKLIGTTKHATWGTIYAYETDGFGSYNIMDDANIPSLLSAPIIGFTDVSDPVYQNTRKMVLSAGNPYFMRGPVINAVGGPHNGPGFAWPMASIVRILTSNDDNEIVSVLKELVSSTTGLGLMHESIWSFDQTRFTRPWFSWVNGLFGQMILDLSVRKPNILQMSFQ